MARWDHEFLCCTFLLSFVSLLCYFLCLCLSLYFMPDFWLVTVFWIWIFVFHLVLTVSLSCKPSAVCNKYYRSSVCLSQSWVPCVTALSPLTSHVVAREAGRQNWHWQFLYYFFVCKIVMHVRVGRTFVPISSDGTSQCLSVLIICLMITCGITTINTYGCTVPLTLLNTHLPSSLG